jgi:hypothetical protein
LIRKIVIVCTVVLLSSQVYGQASSERQALKSIEKGKWDKAYSQLREASGKDSASVNASYLFARYFFTPSNPDYQLDSAYGHILLAIHDFDGGTTKQRERLLRQEIDSVVLAKFQDQVDSAAFIRAKQLNTEEGYVHFLTNFKTARAYFDEAAALRNEAAFKAAVNENTYESFKDFLTRYPQAAQREEATTKYEELLFAAKTSDKQLDSYQKYLIEYPNTAYQREAERNVFEISTASGTIASYRTFLQANTTNYFTRRARDILFHLIPRDQIEDHLMSDVDNDSLRAVVESGKGYIVPFLHGEEFGFMNQQGQVVIQAGREEINTEYRCGDVAEDIIVLFTKIISLNGALVWDHPVESIEDIGYGFIVIQEDSCKSVIHKSGFKVGKECIDEAKVLNGKLLAFRKENRWSIWTFTGRMLMAYDWDELGSIKDVVCLKKKEKLILSTVNEISLLADQRPLGRSDSVDEAKLWRDDLVWVRNGNLQGVVNQSLDTLIRADEQRLTQTYFGSLSATSEGIKTMDDSGAASILFQQVLIQEPWTAVKSDHSWRLYDPKSGSFSSPSYDSISFEGPFAIASKQDSISIYFSAGNVLRVKQPVRAAFIPGQDSSSFLQVEQGGKKSIYALNGKKLFTVSYDDVQYAGEGYFRVYKRDKKGIISSSGKLLLPLSYDAIGSVNNGIVSLLNAMKFGLYDCLKRKLIKPQYEKNLTVYNKTVLTAYKKGLYGFIGWKNEPVSKIEFEEIRFWNDSAALVRKNKEWIIYEISTGKILMDKMQDYRLIRDTQKEKLAIVVQDHKYGVIHNVLGTVIPMSFSDIINVGSSAEPLYFTEKHVEEASIFVVIYYDSKGKMLRREIYEQDDYEKIYCSNK